MAKRTRKWSKDEHILAFNLYCKIPFTKINANYAPAKELARIIGRSNGFSRQENFWSGIMRMSL
ncbi:MAG: hypothetical protein KDC47_03705 [Flavobacteriaceae bacterium]|nr:hypothetical protein [Flavobacteriaceae bacterium]